MATQNELDEAWLDARLALLKRISHAAPNSSGEQLSGMAEAYAWLTSVNQPHG